MKFEKFFKASALSGKIVPGTAKDLWLICGGVGMLIPPGMEKIGIVSDPDIVVNALIRSESDGDDRMELHRAYLEKPDGKAAEIIREFVTEYGESVAIYNGDCGLLEKADVITYMEMTNDENGVIKAMIIRDRSMKAVGFIVGVR